MGILKNKNARIKWNQYIEAVQPLFSLKLSLYGQVHTKKSQENKFLET